MKKHILLILLSYTLTSYAQEPDLSDKIITWNCSSMTDNTNGNIVSQTSTIVSDSNSIKWIQNGSEQVFLVSNRQWDWQTGQGSITYQVEFGGATGTVKIQSNSIDVILNSAAGDVSLSLAVSNYTY